MLPPESQWFFIAGCQRSGTTLMRLILECHSKVSCFDEAQSYRVLAERSWNGPLEATHVGFKIPRFTEQLDSDAPYDLGLPEQPGPFYRRQKVLFMVRDALDAVASMRKLRGERSWLDEWAVAIVEDKASREPAFAQRYRAELARCRAAAGSFGSRAEPRASTTAYGALYWSYKNEALLRYLANGYPVLPVSYEALVTEPARELARVSAWLGIAFEPGMLAHARHEHGELDDRGLAIGNTDPKRTIDDDSVGQWRRWLSPDEAHEVRALTADVSTRVERAIAALAPAAVTLSPLSAASKSRAPVSARPLSLSPRSALQLSGWCVMLLVAAYIATRPIWSFGAADLVFWAAAALAAFAVRESGPSVRTERFGVALLRRVQRELFASAIATTSLWLIAQSIQL